MKKVYNIEALLGNESMYIGTAYTEDTAEYLVGVLNFLSQLDVGGLTNDTVRHICNIMKLDHISNLYYDRSFNHAKFTIITSGYLPQPNYILICDNSQNYDLTFIVKKFIDKDSVIKLRNELNEIVAKEPQKSIYEKLKEKLDDYNAIDDQMLQNIHWSLEDYRAGINFKVLSLKDIADDKQSHYKAVQLVAVTDSEQSILLEGSELDLEHLAIDLNTIIDNTDPDDRFDLVKSVIEDYKLPIAIIRNIDLKSNVKFYMNKFVG